METASGSASVDHKSRVVHVGSLLTLNVICISLMFSMYYFIFKLGIYVINVKSFNTPTKPL